MQQNLLINNQWHGDASGKTMDVVNPATEEVIARVASADRADLDACLDTLERLAPILTPPPLELGTFAEDFADFLTGWDHVGRRTRTGRTSTSRSRWRPATPPRPGATPWCTPTRATTTSC